MFKILRHRLMADVLDIVERSFSINSKLGSRLEAAAQQNAILRIGWTNAGEPVQETDAFNIGYTVGGMTIGFQEASTDNDDYTTDAKDDTRTLGIAVAF